MLTRPCLAVGQERGARVQRVRSQVGGAGHMTARRGPGRTSKVTVYRNPPACRRLTGPGLGMARWLTTGWGQTMGRERPVHRR
jgi:hypothetical protein